MSVCVLYVWVCGVGMCVCMFVCVCVCVCGYIVYMFCKRGGGENNALVTHLKFKKKKEGGGEVVVTFNYCLHLKM